MEFSEHIKTPKVENVSMEYEDNPPFLGTACLTGHHMIFYFQDDKSEEKWFLHRNVDAVEKRFSPTKNVLVLKCKDFRQYQFTFPYQEDAVDICNSIEALSHIAKVSLQYPFFYRAKFKFTENGYDLFSIKSDFRSLSKFSDEWRISDANADFQICQSYPGLVIVPKQIHDNLLIKSANFRHGGRFPVLSYYHSNDRVLFRASQPLIGPNNKRCKEDERLVNAFLSINQRGYIFDTRSQQIALQARSKGGGYENDINYSQWKKIYHNISKYSVQQESLVRIVEACIDSTSNSEKWQSKLESSYWLSHVKDILSAACLISQCIDREGASVFVHGSDGLDSSLQITSLVQIILDPSCRTIYGFLRLIEKEWLYAGHPFMTRCLHSAFSNQKVLQEGPTFTLFLDCVHQLQQQFPLSFEFNGKLLVEIQHHAYGSEFGTFMCNNEKERKKCNLYSKTTSLWTYFLSPEMLTQFFNPVYRRLDGPIWPTVAPQSLTLWEDLFLPIVNPRNRINQVICEKLSEIEMLEGELAKLTAEVCNLEELQQSQI